MVTKVKEMTERDQQQKERRLQVLDYVDRSEAVSEAAANGSPKSPAGGEGATLAAIESKEGKDGRRTDGTVTVGTVSDTDGSSRASSSSSMGDDGRINGAAGADTNNSGNSGEAATGRSSRVGAYAIQGINHRLSSSSDEDQIEDIEDTETAMTSTTPTTGPAGGSDTEAQNLFDADGDPFVAEVVDEEALYTRVQSRVANRMRQAAVEASGVHTVGEGTTSSAGGDDDMTQEAKERKRNLCYLLVTIVAILPWIVGLLLLGTLIGDNEDELKSVTATGPDDDAFFPTTPSGSPKAEGGTPLSDTDYLRNVLITSYSSVMSQSNSSDIEWLLSEQSSSVQYQALSWLVREDPMELPIQAVDPGTLVERYAIAVLYFGTDGPNWGGNYPEFMGNTSVCEWPRDTNEGISCRGGDENSTGSVRSVILGKFATA